MKYIIILTTQMYICELCNYHTNINYNFIRHNDSNKHKNSIKLENIHLE